METTSNIQAYFNLLNWSGNNSATNVHQAEGNLIKQQRYPKLQNRLKIPIFLPVNKEKKERKRQFYWDRRI